MPGTETRRSRDESVRLGEEAIARYVTPNVRPEDRYKFVAIDIDTGEYEIDVDDYTAVKRLRTRNPSAEMFLGCIGQPTTYRM